MQARAAQAIGACAFVGLIVAGCGSGSSANTVTTPPTKVSRTVASTAAPPATTSTTVTTTVQPTSGGSPCTSAQLSAGVGNGQGAAGTQIYQLVFANTGSTACTLQGYPGVSFVGTTGTQLGPPAVRRGSSAGPLISLNPGQSTYATFTFPSSGNICGNGGTPTTGLRVYPPNQTAALFAPFTSAAVCPNAPIGSELAIYPIGVPGET